MFGDEYTKNNRELEAFIAYNLKNGDKKEAAKL